MGCIGYQTGYCELDSSDLENDLLAKITIDQLMANKMSAKPYSTTRFNFLPFLKSSIDSKKNSLLDRICEQKQNLRKHSFT